VAVSDAPRWQDWCDRAEIADVIVAMALAVDARDFVSYREQFTDDARLDYQGAWGPEGSADELAAFLATMTDPANNPHSQHCVSSIRSAVSGDEATARAYYLTPAVMVGPDGEKQLMVNAGEYHAVLRRTPRGWKMAALQVKSNTLHSAPLADLG
jgi:ketosteroid isomerase-like protein